MQTDSGRDRQRTLADQDDLRLHNVRAVAAFVRSRPESSRGDIGDALRLNKATVSSLVTDLIGRGLLEEGGPRVGQGPGRPRSIVRVDNHAHASVVVEILADRVRVGAWTLSRQRLVERDLSIRPARRGPRATLAAVSAEIAAVVAELRHDGRRIVGAVLALPGLLEVRTGTLVASGPLGWRNVAVQTMVRAGPAADVPITVGRIANLATIAEWRRDPARHDLLCLHGSDTGLGAGVVSAGTLLTGSHGRAGELLFGNSPTTAFGHLDDLLRTGRTNPSTVDNLVVRLDAGRRSATSAVAALAAGIADRLATLVALLDPECVVLAGYLAQLGSHLLAPVQRELTARLAFGTRPPVEVGLGRYGTEAAQVGGAILLADTAFELTRRADRQ